MMTTASRRPETGRVTEAATAGAPTTGLRRLSLPGLGIALVAAFSIVAALAPDVGTLIAGRGLAGRALVVVPRRARRAPTRSGRPVTAAVAAGFREGIADALP